MDVLKRARSGQRNALIKIHGMDNSGDREAILRGVDIRGQRVANPRAARASIGSSEILINAALEAALSSSATFPPHKMELQAVETAARYCHAAEDTKFLVPEMFHRIN